MEKKLKLSDEVVEKQLKAWRLAGWKCMCHSFSILYGDNLDNKKIIYKKIQHLYDHPYKNSRRELARWRQLYEEFQPYLKSLHRRVCKDGKRLISDVKALYNNTNVVVPMNFYITVDVSVPAWLNRSDISPYELNLEVVATGLTDEITPKKVQIINAN